MLGFCSSCGTQVMDFNLRGRDRFTPNYAEHFVELSDENGRVLGIMRVAVCGNCKGDLVSGKNVVVTAQKILDNHKVFWENDPHAPRGFKNFQVSDPNTDEVKHRLKKISERDSEDEKLSVQKEEAMVNLDKSKVEEEKKKKEKLETEKQETVISKEELV